MLTRHQIDEFDRTVRSRLAQLARRARLYVLTDGLAVVIAVMLGFVLVQLCLDRLLRLDRDMRAVLLAVGVALTGYTVWRFLLEPMRRRVSVESAALLVERLVPTLGDRLISAVQFTDPAVAMSDQASGPMMSLVVEQARVASEGVRFEAVLDRTRAVRHASAGAGVVAVFMLLALLMPNTFGIWFQRNVLLADVRWPQQVHLHVENLRDGRMIVAAGDDLDISVLAEEPNVPRSVRLEYGPPVDAVGDDAIQPGEEEMIKIGDRRFRATFRQLRRAMRARAVGGDAVTPWFDVLLVERPRVTEATLTIQPPAYTRLPEQELRSGLTMAKVLRGSAVSVVARTNKPIARASLLRGDSVVEELTGIAGADALAVTFTPAESGAYSFRLTDDDGMTNRRPVQFSIRVESDRAPLVKLRIPGLGDMVTPEAILPAEIEMSDTYGMAVAELVQRIAGSDEAEPMTQPTTQPAGQTNIPLADFEPGGRNFTTSLDVELASVDLTPGQRFTVFARAVDEDDIAGPNEGRSNVFSLRVVTPDDLLAELSRREQEYRQEFERIIRDQEALRGRILSTLNRRGSASQPADAADTDADFKLHERRQQELSRRVMSVGRQFERMLAEMEINRVAAGPLRIRLTNRIIDPLARVARQDMIAVADRLGAIARGEPDAGLESVDPDQATLVQTMREILAHMLQWEGFHEAVTILRDILKMQGGLNAETEAELERRLEKLFGPDGS